ncbi:hypothetical protein BT63DRAFT_465778 [Microthyrium microscopicum]|uniref:BTB domain-containing protein n=1 Tax=Microthyrium microscopicum TaxID=703497 RepID=A0A6A6TXM0_9PEZI|nr:hypothetical protein BT63DRAFT_465778 [Microthyrium microscopicum]
MPFRKRPSGFDHSLGPTFDTEKFSDLTVKCGDKSWRLHRVILSAHSPVFEAACSQDFKEAHTGLFIIQEQDPRIAEVVLKMMYKAHDSHRLFRDLFENLATEGISNPYTIWVDLYKCADFFQIEWLLSYIEEVMLEYAEQNLNPLYSTGASRLEYVVPNLQDQGGPRDAKEVADFVEGIRYAIGIFGADSVIRRFERLLYFCAPELPILMVSKCWKKLCQDAETALFTSRVFSLHFCGETYACQDLEILELPEGCWGCDHVLTEISARTPTDPARYYCNTCWPILREWLHS